MSKKLISKLFVLTFLLGTLGFIGLPVTSASTPKWCTKDSDCPRGYFCLNKKCESIQVPCPDSNPCK
jgi:hypothetical protein